MLTLLHGDALTQLKTLETESVQTCVTSPPYWGLRDYGTGQWIGGESECEHRVRENHNAAGTSTLQGGKKTVHHAQEGFREECPRCGAIRVDVQIGLEKTPEAYAAALVDVFREVKRVLRSDGTLWLNLGDSYAASGKGGNPEHSQWSGFVGSAGRESSAKTNGSNGRPKPPLGMKPKDLVGIPWMVAFALRADGWYLRSDIIWSKPNPMPESVTDRPTKSHEYIFLLAKSQKYYFDQDAVKEQQQPCSAERTKYTFDGARARLGQARINGQDIMRGDQLVLADGLRNIRSVWHVATQPYPDAHFATYPKQLITPCILAGSKAGDTVLDPFAGSGTTGKVAIELGRKAVLIEPKAEYVEMIERRCKTTIGLPLAI